MSSVIKNNNRVSSGNSEREGLPSTDIPLFKTEILKGSDREYDLSKVKGMLTVVDEAAGIKLELSLLFTIGSETILALSRATINDRAGVILSRVSDQGGRSELLDYLEDGDEVTIGRNEYPFFDAKVSREHFSLRLVHGSLLVTDRSTNGTKVSTRDDKESDSDTSKQWIGDFTRWAPNSSSIRNFASRRTEKQNLSTEFGLKKKVVYWDITRSPNLMTTSEDFKRQYEESFSPGRPARYGGRDVIMRDSRIHGGVFIVPGSEAIVVSDTYNDGKEIRELPGYAQAYDAFVDSWSKLRREEMDTSDIELSAVCAAYQTVLGMIAYDLEYSSKINEKFADEKINLANFILDGKGVCSHQALLAGYLLEKAIDSYKLTGKVSVDRNRIGENGHAWARYTGHDGQVYIIDAAQRFAGSLNDAMRRNRTWVYRRSTE